MKTTHRKLLLPAVLLLAACGKGEAPFVPPSLPDPVIRVLRPDHGARGAEIEVSLDRILTPGDSLPDRVLVGGVSVPFTAARNNSRMDRCSLLK